MCSLQDVIDEGVCCVYLYFENKLCVLIFVDLVFMWVNIKDNIFCVLLVEMVLGVKVYIDVVVKGGGSENKLKFKMLNFSDFIVDWVLEMVL